LGADCFINAYPNKKLIDYSFYEQLKDYMPPLIISLIMFGVVYITGFLNISIVIKLLLQVILGIIVYVGLSMLIKVEGFRITYNMLSKMIKK